MRKIIHLIIIILFVITNTQCANKEVVLKGACNINNETFYPVQYNNNNFYESDYISIAWTQYPLSPDLENWVQLLIKNNPSLKEMKAKIQQLQYEYKAQKSLVYPKLSLSALFGMEYKNKDFNGSSTNLSFPMSYEVDVWKKIADINDISLLEVEIKKHEKNALVVALVSQFLQNIFYGNYIKKKLDIYDDIHKLLDKSIELVEQRHKVGLDNKTNVYKLQERIEEIIIAKENFNKELILIEHLLSVMLGEYPGKVFDNYSLNVPDYLLNIPETMPSDLLKRRPDINAWILRLRSSELGVNIAKKDILPSIKLSSNVGASSSQLVKILNKEAFFASLFVNLMKDVWDGGKKKAIYESKQYQHEALLNEYKSVVLNAFKEVEDALTIGYNQFKILNSAKKRLNTCEKRKDIAEERYEAGIDNAITFIDAKVEYLFRNIEYIEEEWKLLLSRITLFKALGGPVL